MEAAKQVNVNVPIIIRLEGTNREIGRESVGKVGTEFHRGRRYVGRRPKGGGPGLNQTCRRNI